MKKRFQLLKLAILHTLAREQSSLFNKWMNLLSTLFYTLTFALFVNVIFSNIKTFAGYTKDEILFLAFITQTAYYIFNTWAAPNLDLLQADVRKGTLDFVFLKPMPHLYFISIRTFNILTLLRDAVPPIIAMSFIIHWENLSFNLTSTIAGIIVFILGQISFEVIHFLLLMPVFFWGESSNLRMLGWTFDDLNKIPYEGLEDWMKKLFGMFLPLILGGVYAASVFLNKTDSLTAIITVSIIATIFLIIKFTVWNITVKHYTSAA